MLVRSVAVAALVALSAVACSRATPPPQPSAPPAAAPAAAEAPPPAAQSEAARAPVAADTPSEERADTSLEHLAAMPADQQLPGGRWKAGTNYVPIVPAQPTSVGPDKVEVLEVFWYACPHCFDLEPFIQSWLKKKPANVEFVRVPVMWGPVHRAHAHLYYTLQALQRSDLDQKVFETIHNDHNMLFTNNEPETLNQQVQFAVAHGINADAFRTAYNSFTVSSNLARAEELTARYHVDGVPLIIVNGKYETDVGKAGGPSELMALISDLVASEKRH
ncbi:MAG TPA: thiol:disulfide interchange protein DsbA/DsbL [Steroidobacteraceae bacterium]|jgi:thiol:disulfide interchange protein DsbA|nr:thiol:disulfide interchange protein DsbA/DsbL [Steroidobacteraceae bacterium]